MKRTFFFILLAIALPTICATAQTELIQLTPYEYASFKGGEVALERFLKENIRLPEKVKKGKIFAIVEANFVVTKTGNITDIKISPSGCTECDKEAQRLVKKMPKWNAGKEYKNTPANTLQGIRINFTANAENFLFYANSFDEIYNKKRTDRGKMPESEETEIVQAEYPPVAVDIPKNHEEDIFIVVQQRPEFKGGIDSLNAFIKRNLKYPETAKKNGKVGKVFVKFVITKTGKAEKHEIVRGIRDCPECDAEALRVVKLFPEWISGKQNGNDVNVYYTLPITFKSEE